MAKTIKVQWPGDKEPTAYDKDELRSFLDKAIRSNEDLYDIVVDVAGTCLAEKVSARMKKMNKHKTLN